MKNGVVTSASGFTIDINGLGAKPVYSNMAAETRETTIFNVNYTLLLIYDSTRVEGGCWINYRGYYSDSNSIGYQLRTNSTVLKTADASRYYRLFFTSANGTHWVPANTAKDNSATSTKTVNQRAIDPHGRIIYYSATTNLSAESDVSAAYCWDQYVFALGYSFNRTGKALALTTKTPVYIKCAPQADGSAIIDSTTPYVQSLPSTEDGKIYIFLGIAYSATNVELVPNHPVYEYKDGAIRLWTNASSSPGIESETYEVLFGGQFTVTTAADAEHEHPWVRTNITSGSIREDTRYRITFDGESYVLPGFGLCTTYNDEAAGRVGYDSFTAVGAVTLFRISYSGLFVKPQNVPFLLVYGDGTGTSYLDVYTEAAGEHTVLVESESAEYSQIDPYLVYGMGTTPFGFRYAQMSLGANEIIGDLPGFAVGAGNVVSGRHSFAAGAGCEVSGLYSCAVGIQNKASGQYSFAGGSSCHSEANGAFTYGSRNVAKAAGSHAEGYYTRAESTASRAHVEGYGCRTYAEASHVEGGGTWADASQTLTHIGGVNNAKSTETGKTVQIIRYLFDGTTVRDVVTMTLGKYAEVIGNGDSDDARSNARTLDWDGNEAIAGSLTLGLGTANEITLTPAQLTTVLASLLPSVSASDNGKVLTVVNGAWAAAELPTYQGDVS